LLGRDELVSKKNSALFLTKEKQYAYINCCALWKTRKIELSELSF